jgi:hypothetical protein
LTRVGCGEGNVRPGCEGSCIPPLAYGRFSQTQWQDLSSSHNGWEACSLVSIFFGCVQLSV